MTTRFYLLLLAYGLSISRCPAQAVVSARPADSASDSPGDIRTPSSPTTTSTTGQRPSQFVLGAADVIRVNVWKNPDLSQSVVVGPDGFVSLPLLGEAHVAGMTADQLAQDLSTRLSVFVVSPQVTVSVIEIRSRQVFVLGQVGKPGSYPLLAPTTVLQLIAQAGGLSTYANRKGILIIREAHGNTQRLRFNYSSAINGDDKQNITLQPGDTVIVR